MLSSCSVLSKHHKTSCCTCKWPSLTSFHKTHACFTTFYASHIPQLMKI